MLITHWLIYHHHPLGIKLNIILMILIILFGKLDNLISGVLWFKLFYFFILYNPLFFLHIQNIAVCFVPYPYYITSFFWLLLFILIPTYEQYIIYSLKFMTSDFNFQGSIIHFAIYFHTNGFKYASESNIRDKIKYNTNYFNNACCKFE